MSIHNANPESPRKHDESPGLDLPRFHSDSSLENMRSRGSTSGGARHDPEEILAGVAASMAPQVGSGSESLLLQDWCVLVESLEWKLARCYWETRGVEPFVRSEVPYIVNNTAWVARGVSALVTTIAAERAESSKPLVVLELGAGIGLFARHVLDAIRAQARATGRSESIVQPVLAYDRLVYVITDGSRRTVERWIESGVFADHLDRVVLGVCDANALDRITRLGGSAPFSDENGSVLVPGSVDLVLANYLFDSLPTTVVRATRESGENAYRELHVRTFLPGHLHEEARRRSRLEVDEILRRATSPDSSELEPLLPILPLLELDCSYRPLQTKSSHLAALEPFCRAPEETPQASSAGPSLVPPTSSDLPGDRCAFNYGALELIDRCRHLLADTGLLLYRDFGPAHPSELAAGSRVPRFGGSLAAAVAFPVIEKFLEHRGLEVIVPSEDAQRTIHTRLAGRSITAPVREAFRASFDDDRYGVADRLVAEALGHIHAGRMHRALECYRAALQQCPDDWQILGEIAQFLTQQMQRFPEAAILAERALSLNPSFSASLWNTLGNARFCLGEIEAAHEAYLHAQAIHPADAQTQLDLAFTYTVFGDLEAALVALARGLAYDLDGRFEAALLSKQREVLGRISGRRAEESDRLERRRQLFDS